MTRLAIVLAGGGERAVAWELGVLAGLREAGLDPAAADLHVGTSAGAYVATLLAAGAPLEPPHDRRNGAPADAAVGEAFARALGAWMEAAELGPVGQRRRVGAIALSAPTRPEEDFVAATAARLPTDRWPASLVIAAVDVRSGTRAAFGAGDGVPLDSALAASRAIPGLLPPVAIGGRRYIDGAVGSATNADLALSAARVLIVTPTPAQPPARTLESLWDAALDDEVRRLRAAGGDVVAIRATSADLDAMGPDLMSGAQAARAFAAGVARGLAACRP
jgi:NTE family protein